MNQVQKYSWWQHPALIVLCVSILGVLWRLYLFSGDGLGDDPNFFSSYYRMFDAGKWHPFAYNYRIGLWLPIFLCWKLFGVSEVTWILPITLSSVCCIPLTYLLGRSLFSERAGWMAAALAAVCPFDVLTSTLFVNDIPFSFYAAISMLFFFLGIESENRKYALWFTLAAFFTWWSYMTKMWGLFMLPIFGLISIINYRKWRPQLVFYLSLSFFFIASLLLDWRLTGDPFGYYHAEVRIAGLWKVTSATLLEYPRLMFLPNWYGRFFYGFYCWLTVPALFLAAFRWRKIYFPAVWLLLIFLTMEFMPQKIDFSGWYSQARIFRYLSVLVIPSCLILAYATEEILKRWRNIGVSALILFIGIALVQGYRVTWPSRDAFDDVRQAASKVLTFPGNPIYSDYMMMSYIERFHFQYKDAGIIKFIRAEKPEERELEFLKISNAYVITGGARNPYYGCGHCIANIGNFAVPNNWKLLWTLNKPSEAWRKEPLRIWKVGSSPDLEKEISRYKETQELYQAASKLFFDEKYEEARVMFKSLLEKGMHSEITPWAWWYYGITFMRLGNPKDALAEFDKWLMQYRGHELEPEVYYHIGVCYKNRGEIEKAVEAFAYVLEKFSNSPAKNGSQDVLREIQVHK